jgi:hypothetical protein
MTAPSTNHVYEVDLVTDPYPLVKGVRECCTTTIQKVTAS